MDDAFEVLNEELLLELAGPASFERGVGYHVGGNVQTIDVVAPGTLRATVGGTRTYTARLTVTDAGRVTTACTCPVGEDGLTCKHVVAAGLGLLAEQGRLDARIEDQVGAKKPRRKRKARARRDPMADLWAALADAPRELLEQVVAEGVVDDARARDALLARLSAASVSGVDPAPFKRLLQQAFRINGFIEYRRAPEWASRVMDAIAALDDLIASDPAEAVVLCEYGLKRCEQVYQRIDDSGGEITMIMRALEQRHAVAAAAGRVDGVALAERLYAMKVDAELGSMDEPFDTHGDVLGDEGRARYRELALGEWAELKGVKDSDQERSYRKLVVRSCVEHIARHDRDVKLLAAAIDGHTASWRATRIAQACLDIEAYDDAIEWARKVRDTEGQGQASIHEIRARARLGRNADGDLEAAAEHALEAFTAGWRMPMLDLLLEIAGEIGEQPTWRYRAFAAAEALDEANRHEVLARMHLHLGEIDEAWDAADSGPCSVHVRMDIAEQRQTDHPEDLARVLLEQVDAVLDARTNSGDYPGVVADLAKADALLASPEGRAEFDAKIAELRDPTGHGRKPSLMRLLGARGWV